MDNFWFQKFKNFSLPLKRLTTFISYKNHMLDKNWIQF